MFKQIKNIIKFVKEIFNMTFKPDSQIVKSYVILILAGKMAFDEVPDIFNLRQAVENKLDLINAA